MVAGLTVRTATQPECYPLRRMLKENQYDECVSVVARILAQADVACGGDPRPEMMELWASMILTKWAHFSIESLILALRDGIMGGKVYGKLNLPQISEWLTAMDRRICDLSEADAGTHRSAADNLGSEYLNRLEHAADTDKRKLQRATAHIAELEKKLKNKDPKVDQNI